MQPKKQKIVEKSTLRPVSIWDELQNDQRNVVDDFNRAQRKEHGHAQNAHINISALYNHEHRWDVVNSICTLQEHVDAQVPQLPCNAETLRWLRSRFAQTYHDARTYSEHHTRPFEALIRNYFGTYRGPETIRLCYKNSIHVTKLRPRGGLTLHRPAIYHPDGSYTVLDLEDAYQLKVPYTSMITQDYDIEEYKVQEGTPDILLRKSVLRNVQHGQLPVLQGSSLCNGIELGKTETSTGTFCLNGPYVTCLPIARRENQSWIERKDAKTILNIRSLHPTRFAHSTASIKMIFTKKKSFSKLRRLNYSLSVRMPYRGGHDLPILVWWLSLGFTLAEFNRRIRITFGKQWDEDKFGPVVSALQQNCKNCSTQARALLYMWSINPQYFKTDRERQEMTCEQKLLHDGQPRKKKRYKQAKPAPKLHPALQTHYENVVKEPKILTPEEQRIKERRAQAGKLRNSAQEHERKELLPHIGLLAYKDRFSHDQVGINLRKAEWILHSIRDMILVHFGHKEPTDLNDLNMKYIKTIDCLMANLARMYANAVDRGRTKQRYSRQFRASIGPALRHIFVHDSDPQRVQDILLETRHLPWHIILPKPWAALTRHVVSGLFQKSFSSTQTSGRNSTSMRQQQTRTTRQHRLQTNEPAQRARKARVISTVNQNNRRAGPRNRHGSSPLFFANMTSSGDKCGLSVVMARHTHISSTTNPDAIFRTIRQFGAPFLSLEAYRKATLRFGPDSREWNSLLLRYRRFCINTTTYAYIQEDDVERFRECLLFFRRTQWLPVDVEIWINPDREVHVNCCGGRPMVAMLRNDLRTWRQCAMLYRRHYDVECSELYARGLLEWIGPDELRHHVILAEGFNADALLSPSFRADKQNTNSRITHFLLDASFRNPLSEATAFSFTNLRHRNLFNLQQVLHELSPKLLEVVPSHIYTLLRSEEPLLRSEARVRHNEFGAVGGQLLLTAISPQVDSEEDAWVLQKRAVDLGAMATRKTHSYYTSILRSKPILWEELRPVLRDRLVFNQRLSTKHIEPDGLPKIGSYLKEGDAVASKVVPSRQTIMCEVAECLRQMKLCVDASLKTLRRAQGYVSGIYFQNANEDTLSVIVQVTEVSSCDVGAKLTPQTCFKGEVARLLPESDGFADILTGAIPSITCDPHEFPSRMSVGPLFEMLTAKLLHDTGKTVSHSPDDTFLLPPLVRWMKTIHLPSPLKRMVINNRNGRFVQQGVTLGMMLILTLIQRASQKYGVRGSSGACDTFTRQPVAGCIRNGGGLKLGEMERDALINYGDAGILQNFVQSMSPFLLYVCTKCRFRARKDNDVATNAYCPHCRSGKHVVKMVWPFSSNQQQTALMAKHVTFRFRFAAREGADEDPDAVTAQRPTKRRVVASF